MPKLMYEPYLILILLEEPEPYYFFKGYFYQSLIPLSKSCHKGCSIPCFFVLYFSQQVSLCKVFIEKEFKATLKATEGTGSSNWCHHFQISALNVWRILPWWSSQNHISEPKFLSVPYWHLYYMDLSQAWTVCTKLSIVNHWVHTYHYMML